MRNTCAFDNAALSVPETVSYTHLYILVLYGGCGCRKAAPAPSIGEFE